MRSSELAATGTLNSIPRGIPLLVVSVLGDLVGPRGPAVPAAAETQTRHRGSASADSARKNPMRIALPFALSCASALLTTPSPQLRCARAATAASSRQPRMCAFDESPSDSGDDDLNSNTMDTTTAVTEMPVAPAHDDEQRRTELRMQLFALAAGCCRGEAATDDDLRTMRATVTELEELNPTPEPTRSPSCAGTWELSLSDTQLFRSSPFSWLAAPCAPRARRRGGTTGSATCTAPRSPSRRSARCARS